MGYIKSYSNYVLKKKHAKTNDGDIFERDITTVGGVDNFTTGQNPIYRSGSFLITVNADVAPAKKKTKGNWVENENGNVWNYSDVAEYSSDTIEDDKIVIKNDYRSLVDYAYYGSCSELVRASLNDILDRFPGELYSYSAATSWFTVEQIPYRIGDYRIGSDARTVESIGENNLISVLNPFSIDIHTQYKNESEIENVLKYFCNDGYKNYQLFVGNNEPQDIIEWNFAIQPPIQRTNLSGVEITGYCKGDLMYVITLVSSGGTTLPIKAYLGDDSSVEYMVDTTYQDYHVRPKKSFYDQYIKSLDYFESALLDTTTEPLYKATFEVFEEGENGYRSRLETFVFPRGAGGYNIGSNVNAYNNYVSKFLKYTDFYDEHFSDNLYRMMTHESIKNFDWSYYVDNDAADEYKVGHTKIDQLLRLFGREFDEIKLYIDGIKNYNQLTYSDNNNMPDYFLTDSLEQDGWDINNIYPLVLTEYDLSGNTIDVVADNQLVDQSGFTRVFNQDLDTIIHPYAQSALTYPNGYYIIPKECTDDGTDCDRKNFEFEAASEKDNDPKLYYFTGINSSTITKVDNKEDSEFSILKNKISKFISNADYTYKDINAMFLKRLKLNSRHILRHKGTIEGVEMMLGLFGLRSKNYYDQWYRYVDKGCDKTMSGTCRYSANTYDYEITEYTSFTNGILDKDWFCKAMPTIDWYNNTKLISYGTQQYVPYQGLPITYRNKYFDNTENKYVDDIAEFINYDSETKLLEYYSSENEFVKLENVTEDRILYPYFNSDDRYDGNPYYQMNGGWIKNIPMMYDKYNHIIESSPLNELYTETIDTVKKVDTVMDLFIQPISELEDGDVFYVEDISQDYLLIDGVLHRLDVDSNGNKFLKLQVYNHTVKLNDSIFNENILVWNPYMDGEQKRVFNLSLLEDGYTIKAFMINGETQINDDTTNYNLDFVGEIVNFSGGTNYFKISNRQFKNTINTEDGWYQLMEDDEDFIKVNTLRNYFKGNNPHKGNLQYDGGYKYMSNFARLFNYSVDNELFDDRRYDGGFYSEEYNINNIGFKNLINDNLEECDRTYPISADSKIHYFGNYFKIGWCSDENNYDIISSSGASDDSRHDHEKPYTDDTEDVLFDYNKTPEECWYDYEDYKDIISEIVPSGNTTTAYFNDYQHWKDNDIAYICSGASVDASNYQIVNTKVFKLKFYMYSSEKYSKEYMEEIKYYQTVVMPYVEQMIPSTAIVEVEYCLRENN